MNISNSFTRTWDSLYSRPYLSGNVLKLNKIKKGTGNRHILSNHWRTNRSGLCENVGSHERSYKKNIQGIQLYMLSEELQIRNIDNKLVHCQRGKKAFFWK